jgi:hypothetical protein
MLALHTHALLQCRDREHTNFATWSGRLRRNDMHLKHVHRLVLRNSLASSNDSGDVCSTERVEGECTFSWINLQVVY